ncbi:MAG: hypothetical protein HZC01_04325 [Candidatus Kerfeldbacteria bacterium]|nr:hypothetical protein [Candidatus Kerfeldbacteria bacterium]
MFFLAKAFWISAGWAALGLAFGGFIVLLITSILEDATRPRRRSKKSNDEVFEKYLLTISLIVAALGIWVLWVSYPIVNGLQFCVMGALISGCVAKWIIRPLGEFFNEKLTWSDNWTTLLVIGVSVLLVGILAGSLNALWFRAFVS